MEEAAWKGSKPLCFDGLLVETVSIFQTDSHPLSQKLDSRRASTIPFGNLTGTELTYESEIPNFPPNVD
jgi:hypothetical protein